MEIYNGPFRGEKETEAAFLLRCNRELRCQIRELRKELEKVSRERDDYKAALANWHE